MSSLPNITAFTDFFRRVLGWKNAKEYIVPLLERKKRTPAGCVHVPTAEKVRIRP
ncbi:MAG: hypothetical protein IJD43_11330 [Thermoguttaceae bacterium]|nr:hypothetical protein [Thermoguttaceae bacterium]